MARIALVGCGALKSDAPAPAQDLYTGNLFRLARAYAEQTCDRWFILSAAHGLVEPTRVLSPYDQRMDKSRRGQERWGDRVRASLRMHTALGDTLVFLAGNDYIEAVRWWNLAHQAWSGRAIEKPLEGLGIGQRMAWLKAQLEIK